MNTTRLKALRASQWSHILPIKSGMQIELHEEVGDEGNRRIWRFKWLVIKVKKPNHPDGTFTIRGKTAGHTIEKIYPLSFPSFKKVLLLDEYKIRRARLYYIREKVGKDARMTSVLSKEEKNVDLLALALAEIEAIQAAYEEANTPAVEASTPEVEETKEVVSDNEETPDEINEEQAEETQE